MNTFFVTGGTLRYDTPSYVARSADQELFNALVQGEFCYILTSRQMGKSSLMAHTAFRLRQHQTHIIALDLTAIGQNLSPEQWYDGLALKMGRQIRLEDEVEDYWMDHHRMGPCLRFFLTLREVVLPKCPGPIVIFIDELDTIRSLPFSTDEFFSAIRECYNRRGQDHEWKRITFCLLGVATPSDLISQPRAISFNIGKRIILKDFSRDEAAPLALGLASPLQPYPDAHHHLFDRVYFWTGGHPYLTQRLCRNIAEYIERHTSPTAPLPLPYPTTSTVDRLCNELFLSNRARERDDNLLFVRERLLREMNASCDPAALLDLYGRIRRRQNLIQDDETNPLIETLHLSGIVREQQGYLRVRNQIYYRVFNREWIQANMPDAEKKRQRAAFLHGLTRAAFVSAIILTTGLILSLAAINQGKLAQSLAKKNQEQLIQLKHATGNRLMEEGNSLNALPWFIDALSLKNASSEKEQNHRQRIQLLINRAPSLDHIFFHSAPVTHVAWSHKGDLLVTTSADHTAQIRNPFSGEPVGPPLTHNGPILYATFSPSDSLLLTTSEDHTAQLWDVATQRPVSPPLTHYYSIPYAAFSPDEKAVVTVSLDDTAQVWDVQSGHLLYPPLKHHGPVLHATYNPNGDLLVTTSEDHTAQVWDSRLGSAKYPPLIHAHTVSHAAFSPDGRILATTTLGGKALLWDPETGRPLLPPLLHGSPIWHAEFSPDGTLLLTACQDGKARLWDVKTGSPANLPLTHEDTLHTARFSPDGSKIVTASADKTIRVWDTQTALPLTPPLPQGRAILQAAFDPTGSLLLTASQDGTSRLWDLAATPFQTKTLKHALRLTQAHYDPTGTRVITTSTDHSAIIWDAERNTPLVEIRQDQDYLLPPSEILMARFSPNGNEVALVNAQNEIKLFDAFTGAPLTDPLPHPDRILSIAFCPSQPVLITACQDLWLRFWDMQGRQIAPPIKHTSPIQHITFNPSGSYLLLTTSDNRAYLRNTSNWQLLLPGLRFSFNQGTPVFSPNGMILMVHASPTSVQLWDILANHPIGNELSHSAAIQQAAFSPDSSLLVTSSADHTARIWDVSQGTPLTPPLKHHGPVNFASFNRSGQKIITASQDGFIRLWDATNGDPLSPPIQHPGSVLEAWINPYQNQILCWSEQEAHLIEIPPTQATFEELNSLGKLLTHHHFDSSGSLVPVPTTEIKNLWETYKPAPPNPSGPLPHPITQHTSWFFQQLYTAHAQSQWYAAWYFADLLTQHFPHLTEVAQLRNDSYENLRKTIKMPLNLAEIQKNIPPRPSDTPPYCLDLTPYYNTPLQTDWVLDNTPTHLFQPLPDNFPSPNLFDLRGFIQLNGLNLLSLSDFEYPNRIPRIPIGQKTQALHFLHAAAWGTDSDLGDPVAHYLLHYENGHQWSIPIIYGKSLSNAWTSDPDPSLNLDSQSRAIAHWTATPPLHGTLFLTTCQNPFPDWPLSHLEIISNQKPPSLLLFGINLQPIPPQTASE